MSNLINNITILIILFSLISCTQEDETELENKISYAKPIWKYNNTQSDINNIKSSVGFCKGNLILNNKVLISGIGSDGYQSLFAVDLSSGNELWQWNNVFDKNSFDISIDNYHWDSHSFYYNRKEKIYSINIENGITNWRTKKPFFVQYNSISGIDNQLFAIADDSDTIPGCFTQSLLKLDINSGESSRFLYPDLSNISNKTLLDYVTSFYDTYLYSKNNDTLIILKGGHPSPNNELQNFIDVYNLTTNKWLYRGKFAGRATSNNATVSFEVVDEKIYVMIGAQIVCHDLWTGEEIWHRDFKYHLQSAGFTISDGRLVTNNEFGQLHCVDIHTGRDIWAIEHDKSGPIRIVNGILYYSGWSTNQIHARRLSDGSEVWRLDPGRYDGAEDFKPDIYAVEGKNGEKGKIIVQTYGHAYCLEAFQ